MATSKPALAARAAGRGRPLWPAAAASWGATALSGSGAVGAGWSGHLTVSIILGVTSLLSLLATLAHSLLQQREFGSQIAAARNSYVDGSTIAIYLKGAGYEAHYTATSIPAAPSSSTRHAVDTHVRVSPRRESE